MVFNYTSLFFYNMFGQIDCLNYFYPVVIALPVNLNHKNSVHFYGLTVKH